MTVSRLTFRAPWWLCNGHLQTLWAGVGHRSLGRYQARQQQVALPDGDALVLHDDCPAEWTPTRPVVLLLHGLCGSHASPLLQRLSHKFSAQNVRCFRLDLRGCGSGTALARLPYHAGCSADLAAAIDAICATTGQAPLAVCGMSLSANILLKYLGEHPERVSACLRAALAVNPPMDLARSVKLLKRPWNWGYDQYFVRRLQSQLKQRQVVRPDLWLNPKVWRARTLFELDECYTSVANGFTDAAEYYARTSADQFLAAISVPTQILTSVDDPLVPPDMILQPRHPWSQDVRVQMVSGGGHVGYRASLKCIEDGYWLDAQILNWALGECEAT